MYESIIANPFHSPEVGCRNNSQFVLRENWSPRIHSFLLRLLLEGKEWEVQKCDCILDRTRNFQCTVNMPFVLRNPRIFTLKRNLEWIRGPPIWQNDTYFLSKSKGFNYIRLPSPMMWMYFKVRILNDWKQFSRFSELQVFVLLRLLNMELDY